MRIVKHKVEVIKAETQDELVKRLNEFGKNGWELVNMETSAQSPVEKSCLLKKVMNVEYFGNNCPF